MVLDVHQARAVPVDDPKLPRSMDGVEGVLVPKLLVLELGLGDSAHLDPDDATAKWSNALLSLV